MEKKCNRRGTCSERAGGVEVKWKWLKGGWGEGGGMYEIEK